MTAVQQEQVNKGGRPKGSTTKISKMQRIANRLEEMARIAQKVNEETDNIGARRLHTILEKLLEELLFEASEMQMGEVSITKKYVEEKIGHIAEDQDLSQYIL